MATGLPPPPVTEPPGSFIWLEWYKQLRNYISVNGSVPWSVINFAGSNITDIGTRLHNTLQGLQGGSTNNMYHLTAAEYSSLVTSLTVTSTATNLTLNDSIKNVLVTATGKLITLPPCTTDRIGQEWNITLGTVGYVDITVSGSDTIYLPTNDTTIRLTNKGATLTVRCLTTSTWGIV